MRRIPASDEPCCLDDPRPRAITAWQPVLTRESPLPVNKFILTMRAAMLAVAVLALALVCVEGQHGHNPFDGSNCTCATFCNSTCAIKPTGAHNTTLYRMVGVSLYGVPAILPVGRSSKVPTSSSR